MCDPASALVASAIVGGVGVGASIYQGEKQRKEGKKAREQANANALKAETQADQEFNRQNKKNPNVEGLQANNTNAAKAGIGSTLLTGPGGINTEQLQLAQNTLLGG